MSGEDQLLSCKVIMSKCAASFTISVNTGLPLQVMFDQIRESASLPPSSPLRIFYLGRELKSLNRKLSSMTFGSHNVTVVHALSAFKAVLSVAPASAAAADTPGVSSSAPSAAGEAAASSSSLPSNKRPLASLSASSSASASASAAVADGAGGSSSSERGGKGSDKAAKTGQGDKHASAKTVTGDKGEEIICIDDD